MQEIAELAVERAWGLDLPVLGELARQSAGGSDDPVLLAGPAVHRTHDLRIARQVGVGRPGALGHDFVPGAVEGLRLLCPGSRGPVAGDRSTELDHGFPGIGDDGERKMLAGIEAGRIDANEPEILLLEHGPGAGGEILQPRADRHHDIGFARQRVGGGRADDAEGSGVHGMRVGHDPPPGNGFDYRNAVLLGKRRQLGAGLRVMDAAAGDDQRPPGVLEHGCGARHLAAIGTGTARLVHPPFEEALGIVIGFALGVLAERQERRPAIGRIEHRGDRLGQRLEDLLRPRDAVPIAGDGPERIVDGERWIMEVLDLLQDRIGKTAGEHVAGKQEHRQAIGVRDAGCGHHVGGSRTDRRGGHHDAAPVHGLGEADRRQRHRLLVLAPPCREPVLYPLERFGKTSDVAVAKNTE